jgi:integrase
VPTLTDKFVRSASEGEHTDEVQRGLILLVRPSTSKSRTDELRRSWVLRVVHGGKRKRIGLGQYPAASLAEAREKAAAAVRQLEMGQDPTRKGRARLKAEVEAQTYTFKRAVDEYLSEAAPTFKHPKSEAGRIRGLRRICEHLNNKLIEEIGTREIASILKSLAPGTADRTRSALNGVFAFAAVAMERRGVLIRNPLSSDLLKAAGYARNVSHGRQPALSYLCLPAFLSEVEKIRTPSARCLEFIVATASRSCAARLAKYSDIEIETRVWRVPRSDLKDGRYRSDAFVIPLNDMAVAAVAAVEAMRKTSANRARPSPYVFAELDGEPINDMKLITLARALRRTGDWLDPDSGRPFTIHGLRASFRTWTFATRQDREVSELALGHKFHGAVERRYLRDELLDQRRVLLDRWGRHLAGNSAETVPLRRA